ncbi:MAG TPA: RecX family transcriptional regulator [Blastocatellia bacterium]|nr:RecX family transcriptional regulator [Blastocatellia bacterium]
MATGRNRARKPIGRSRGDEPAEGARELSPEEARKRVMAEAIRLLASRARSESQLRERLIEKERASPEIVEECIARLKELGYIDDVKFAESYASSRARTKLLGRSRLARELSERKLSPEVIDEALDAVFDEQTEESLIDRAIQKRIRTHGRPVDRAGASRLFAHLAHLGFEYDLILRKIRSLKMSDELEG